MRMMPELQELLCGRGKYAGKQQRGAHDHQDSQKSHDRRDHAQGDLRGRPWYGGPDVCHVGLLGPARTEAGTSRLKYL